MTVENKDVREGPYTVVTWIIVEKADGLNVGDEPGGVTHKVKDRIPGCASLHDAELTALEYIMRGWCDWAEIHRVGGFETIIVEFD